MTFREFMQENGYDLITTFWEDFSIADKYGVAGVKDTYKRAFSEWEDDYKFFTELTLVLNHKIWQHYESNRELAALYDRLWRAVSAMHRGAEFRHGLVEDVTGHQWSLNRYENDLLTAGCHRIAYNEMERIAKQLGWV